MICKWARDCYHCTATINEGDEMYMVINEWGERQYIDEWCAKIAGILCTCGAKKKPEHETCWDCKRAQAEADGLLCECGKWKKAEHDTCYSCKTAKDDEAGLRCACGKYKKPEYKTCWKCKTAPVAKD